MKNYFNKIMFFFCVSTLLNCSDMKTKIEHNSQSLSENYDLNTGDSSYITLFLCGDVMTGRGIDQVLPYAGDPTLYESYMNSAEGYVELAENLNGPIPKPVDFSYIWGDALNELNNAEPDLRIINLETSVTKSNDYWQGKAVHYRMHPDNIECLTSAKIDFCSIANNHVLDWGYSGLTETIETIKKSEIRFAGAGYNLKEAEAPAVIKIGRKGRVIIFSYGSITSGVPLSWAAENNRSGINLLRDFSDETIQQIKKQVAAIKQQGDVVVASIHWGSNWGYDIPSNHTEFAHKLIDIADVDLIHGHSSHHPRPIEIYKDKLIIYGAGDFLNDYEGITGYQQFRDDLTLMYFVDVRTLNGKLLNLRMVPMQIKKYRLNYASKEDAEWLTDIMNSECEKFKTHFELREDNTLSFRW
jgi:poly-gamma-glutamate synthesis protein (capsule biosynthesis protein)